MFKSCFAVLALLIIACCALSTIGAIVSTQPTTTALVLRDGTHVDNISDSSCVDTQHAQYCIVTIDNTPIFITSTVDSYTAIDANGIIEF